MSKYVYSRLTNSQVYTGWAAGGQDLPQVAHEVFIEGGAHVANKNLITPQGVVTVVTDEQAAFLLQNPIFKMHADAGYVTIEDKQGDVEKVSADLNGNDPSKPLTPEDVNEGVPEVDGEKPTVTDNSGKASSKK
jgi:hypothetical protein